MFKCVHRAIFFFHFCWISTLYSTSWKFFFLTNWFHGKNFSVIIFENIINIFVTQKKKEKLCSIIEKPQAIVICNFILKLSKLKRDWNRWIYSNADINNCLYTYIYLNVNEFKMLSKNKKKRTRILIVFYCAQINIDTHRHTLVSIHSVFWENSVSCNISQTLT